MTKLFFTSIAILMFTGMSLAQTFKGHQIGESIADFLKLEPSLEKYLADCMATAPRELISEEIKSRYGPKQYEQYQREEAELRKQGKHQALLDQDPDVYADKCEAVVGALTTGEGWISGTGYNEQNIYYQKLFDRFLSNPSSSNRTPDHPIDDGRFFVFRKGALISLRMSVTASYEALRDDLTSRLGTTPKEAAVPYQNAFGAKWQNVTAVWDTERLHAELVQEGNPAKPSLPELIVQSQERYKEVLERRKNEPKPLDYVPEAAADNTRRELLGGVVAQPKPVKGEPIRVNGNDQELKLISKVEPVYPELAKRARVSGVVLIQVTVNEEGEVSELKVLRGHPLLDDAAIAAVKQWKYSPTFLNGEPVPVIATATVIFILR